MMHTAVKCHIGSSTATVGESFFVKLSKQFLLIFLCFSFELQGSGVIKAGFAGGHVPKCRFPN